MTLQGVDLAIKSVEARYWQERFSWPCPHRLRAKLYYRTPTFIRLWEYVSLAQRARRCLQLALIIVPDDMAVWKEQQKAEDWYSSLI